MSICRASTYTINGKSISCNLEPANSTGFCERHKSFQNKLKYMNKMRINKKKSNIRIKKISPVKKEQILTTNGPINNVFNTHLEEARTKIENMSITASKQESKTNQELENIREKLETLEINKKPESLTKKMAKLVISPFCVTCGAKADYCENNHEPTKVSNDDYNKIKWNLEENLIYNKINFLEMEKEYGKQETKKFFVKLFDDEFGVFYMKNKNLYFDIKNYLMD
jgi:hypothetical protein